MRTDLRSTRQLFDSYRLQKDQKSLPELEAKLRAEISDQYEHQMMSIKDAHTDETAALTKRVQELGIVEKRQVCGGRRWCDDFATVSQVSVCSCNSLRNSSKRSSGCPGLERMPQWLLR